DPPKTSTLQFLVSGLSATKIVHSQAYIPSRDVHFAFMVRVDAHKAKETKPFADVKAALLEQWIEEHAKEKAIDAAQAFVDGIVAQAQKTLPAEKFAAVDQRRDDALKAIDAEKELTDEARRTRKSGEHERWVDAVQSIVGPTVSATFPADAQ